MDLNLGIISDVEKKLKKKLLIDYLYSNLKHHNFWAYRYFFCEFLALLNVSGERRIWSIYLESLSLLQICFLRECMTSNTVTVTPLLQSWWLSGKYKEVFSTRKILWETEIIYFYVNLALQDKINYHSTSPFEVVLNISDWKIWFEQMRHSSLPPDFS